MGVGELPKHPLYYCTSFVLDQHIYHVHKNMKQKHNISAEISTSAIK